MGKKKFIDKKKSATFQLLARDSSDPNPVASSTSDRVFVRVDRNLYSSHGFLEDEYEDADFDTSLSTRLDDTNPNSIFADAPDDADSDEYQSSGKPIPNLPTAAASGTLPDHVRRDILELGLPDDGYNYLLHLREIKNTGGGSSYYQNSKAKLDLVPLDVKAYDASRLRIHSEVDGDSNTNSIYSVASKTIGVKIQKAADPDVAALLDDSDLSRFGSDEEGLEEYFVVQANLPEEGEEEINVEENTGKRESSDRSLQTQEFNSICGVESRSYEGERGNELGSEKPRVPRLLDEQFDLLTLREYDRDSESDDVGSVASGGECLAKLNHVLKDYVVDDLDLNDKYRVPGDFLQRDEGLIKGDSPADVIRRCAEYAEMYSNENQDNEDLVVLQETSDEAEIWDCETIVSTYSNLDNHPGKIQAPEKPRNKLAPAVSVASDNNSNIISLRGKEKLPVDFLPHNGRTMEKVKKVAGLGADQPKKRPHGEESKEEKKERKSAVKEERREARRAKKEMKGLYRSEAQQAQRVVAISGPSSIHLM